MPGAKTLRVGVVGLGMGKNHAWAAVQVPQTTLTAIAEPQEERYHQFIETSAKKGETKVAEGASRAERFDDYQTMVESGAVDAVCIALPTDMHYHATQFCLRKGMHVMCEKPPTTRAVEMLRIARNAYERGLAYAYVRQQRFDPKKMACRELAQKGKLGRVYHAESHWMRSRGIPFRGGWGVNKNAGGGVLLDLGVHKVDDAWFCMGNPAPVVAFGGMHCGFDYLAKGQKLSMAYDADDLTVGMIRFADGATLSLSTSFAMNRVHADHLQDGVVPRSEWQDLHVLGTKAGVDVYRGKLIADHPDGVEVKDLPMTKRVARMKVGFQGLVADFAKSALKGTEPMNSARQAVQLMYMLEALRKSSETGKTVRVKSGDL